MIGSFSGVSITVSANATERVLRWPEKKRSRRLHKKLTKRLGPQVWNKPVAFRTPMGIVMHPDLYEELKRRKQP